MNRHMLHDTLPKLSDRTIDTLFEKAKTTFYSIFKDPKCMILLREERERRQTTRD